MSFHEHATHGPVSIIGYEGKIYLNHPITLSKVPENDSKPFSYFMHCMALNRDEAKDLSDAILCWLMKEDPEFLEMDGYRIRNISCLLKPGKSFSEKLKDFVVMMSCGNPGALKVLSALMESEAGMDYVFYLYDLDIRGPEIWIGYSDYCKRDMEKYKEMIVLCKGGPHV